MPQPRWQDDFDLWRSERDVAPQEPGFEPDIQQQEITEPSYWENPQTLSMHYQFLNNGVDYPWGAWLEPNLLNNAYNHLKKFNEAKPSWLDWEALPNSDPYAGILRSMAVPPPEEQYQSIISRYPEVMDFLAPPEAEQIPELTTTQQQLTTGTSPSENVVMSPEMWNELPSFQRVMAGVMSSPILQGAATMLPFSLWSMAGALAGAAVSGPFAPVGALVGAVTPLLMGAGLGVIGDPQSYEKLKQFGFDDEGVDKVQKIANSTLWLLNQPAEWLEKGVGATVQLAGEEDKDKLDRMLDNLPAVFGAGAGTYEAYSAQHPTIGNIPAGIEYFIDMVSQGETDIRFAKRGEVWKIGEPEPVPVDVYGKAGLEMARNEILKGAAPIEVLQGMQEMYGFSGMFTDLAGQIFLDPLNVLPLAERKTIGAYAKIADKPMLAKAVQAAKGKGGVETLRIYRNLLRYTGDVDALSSALKKYAGLTPEGRFKELEPTEGPRGAWEYINTLDPSSQTDALATMGVDMAGLLTHMVDNVDDLDKLVKAWTILKPGEVAEVANILKTPMAATLSPALKDYNAKVYDPMSTLWKGGDLHRVLLHQIADAIDDTPGGVLKRMRNAGEAEVIHAQLLEAAAKRGDDAVTALKGDTSFTPAGIKAMLGWFKENPHDFNQFKAQVISGLGDHVANWGIEHYGVKPSRASVRFLGGVMKSIQSIILLGLNPMYLVNNLVNNSVTAMHEGVFGYTSPAHIAEFYNEFGVTPRRSDIGYGPAGEVESITGPLREARRAEGLVQEAQDVGAGVSGKMPMLKLGGAAEVVASRNTTYKGIKQAWNRLWHSDNYAPMPSDVRGEIGDSAAQALITRIDRAKNTGDIDAISKTLGADPGVSAETHIPEIAKELGLSSSDVRTIMGELTDKINRALERGATMTDAVALVEADVKKLQVERLKNDLITRASEVPARVQEEGFAAALSILADMSIGDEDMAMRHFAEWQRFYETVDAVKKMGGKGDMVNAMFDGQFARADGEYKQHYDFKETSWQGILKAMGFGDVGDIDNVHPDVQWFYEATKQGNNIWSDYFEQSQAKRKEFQDSMMAAEWDTKTFGDNYKALESELAAMYDMVAGKENELNIRKGDLFVKMFGEKFGVDKTAGAAEWWKGISDNAVKRQGFMRDFRAFLRGEPVGSLASPEVKALVAGASPKQHRQLWPKFLAEIYVPHIMENNGINADGGWRMFNDIMGRSMEDISGAEKAGYFQSMREAMDQFMPEEVAAAEAVPVEPEVGKAAGILPAPEIEVAHPIAAAGPRALGTLDSLGGPRYESQIYNEGHAWYVRPVLDELVRQSILKGDTPGKADLSKLSPEAMTSMKKWLGEVKQDMTKTKMGAVQLGYHARDMSILNYNSRYGLDNVLGVGFPYHFWFTHSMMNWAIRALDRPAFLAWMGKLAKFSDKSKDERSNLPSRLQGRWGIPQAFLPDWAGGSTWVDPLGKLFPILEFMRPIERMAQSESRFTRQAEFAIMGWARDGQIEQADAELAMTNRDGPIWERAFTQAKLEEGGRDPFDYMSMFVSPALWLTIPAKIMQGKGEEISPMPPSRTIQALATATGIEPLRFLDVEAHIRKSMGINAFGEWGDYYVDRQLANIAAERPEETQEALLAMIDRSGPMFEEALQRVQFEMMLRNPGAAPIYAARTGQGVGDVLGSMVFGWLPAHLLPQSELKQRGLKTQYDAAWDEYNKGNKAAITTFFDENPEYKARLALWDEPEERLRQFLISNVWDQWHTMPKLDQRAASEQLGPVFEDQFLSSETRDYDSLDVGTLAQWAKQMGGVVPEGIDTAQGELELPPKADSAMYQDYLVERERAFPGITNINQAYFQAAPQTQDMIRQNTPITDYWAWNDKYIATHPQLMPYVISEDSKLFGVDFDTANLVYQFKTARHEQWPDYYDMQNEYYADGTSKARKREIMQRLGKAYDWERETITQFPQILPYVRSAESIAKGYLKNNYKSKIDWQAQFDMSKIEPAAVRQLNNYYRSDETLTSGAMIYLRQVWESEGKPGDSLMDWIESMRVQFVGAEL